MSLPLNALRAFEASARHLSFTRAASELNVTQTAVAAQVRKLEAQLGTPLFRRLPRGLALTDEGDALLPMLTDAFGRIAAMLDRFQGGNYREPLTVGAVGTFAVGWLLPRLEAFEREHPVRRHAIADPQQPRRSRRRRAGLCDPLRRWRLARHPRRPAVRGAAVTGLRTRSREPPLDTGRSRPAARSCAPTVPTNGAAGSRPRAWATRRCRAGRCSTPRSHSPPLQPRALASRCCRCACSTPTSATARLVQPFRLGVGAGRYWLTRLQSRAASPAMLAFRTWLLQEAASSAD